VKQFAALLDRIVLSPQRNAKLRLMVDYFRSTPDPDRGYALAALTGDLDIPSVKPAMLRALTEARVDPILFAYSYDYVGDLAETISLIWPAPASADEALASALRLSTVVESLQAASRSEGPRLVENWLDRLDATSRWTLIKLVVGGLRIGVSARLAKQALADFGNRPVNEIEELWHGLEPPYRHLFAWLEGRAPKPESRARAPFRPVMLSHALADDELQRITPDAYAAEWKWDGIRVQAVNDGGVKRLYTRTGDDISRTFPDLVEALDVEGAIDGELLVGARNEKGFAPATFSDLQQRLNRKSVTARLMESHPAFLRAYDCLVDGTEDIRPLTFRERRTRLEKLVARSLSQRIDLSPLLNFRSGEDLAALRAAPPDPVIEGVMLKRWDSVYEPGRPKGPWFKWKRDPHTIDAVLMYAQRGHGKRSSYYSDYTFGVWRESPAGDELVPVGKAYFGFTDAELIEIDRFVRNNTVSRFGPVREVVHEPDKGLVLEVAFEGLARSTRHKSGVAMRFPRIARLRWDKPPSEADRLETLAKLIRQPAAVPDRRARR
jgi:DNA ligase-1